jgi:transcriptional regulator with XRE-family HTH domain
MPPSAEQTREQRGALIAAARADKGLSQSALAQQVGVQKETISRIERGLLGSREPTLRAIAAALDIPVGDLYANPTANEVA